MSSVARIAATAASPTTPAVTASAFAGAGYCPKCQDAAAKDWLAAREADLLPVGYFHLVFTLPAEIAPIAYQNKSVVYDLLFRTSSETLLTIAPTGQSPWAEGPRSKASRRPHRHHRRAPHLGLGDDPSSACAYHRTGWRN